jgi:glycosyltransferase 2 family protein
MKNKIFNIAVVILSLVIFLYFFFYQNGLNQLISVLKVINIFWLSMAIVLMFVYWTFETLIIHELTRLLFSKQKLSKSIKAAMIGQFFGSITPLQTGAQPAVFYALTEEGIDSASASSILMMKFIVHQTTMTVYSLIIIILKFNYFKSIISGLFYLCLLGFAFNLGIILVAVTFSINKRFNKSVLFGSSKFLNKIGLANKWGKSQSKMEKSLNDFHSNALLIAKNIKVVLRVAIINTAQLTVFYSIPYFIYRSFNLSSASIWNMIAAQTLVMMIVSITPLPGGVGGAEGGFTFILKIFFQQNIFPAVILWRIITYYSCIGIGALFVIHKPRNKASSNK